MISFLEVNGIKIDCSDDELADLGLGIADGRYEYDFILNWIKSHETF